MRRLLTAVSLVLAIPLAAQQDRLLPDEETFVREVRKRLGTDDERQQAYAFVETRRQVKLDKAGRPQGESVKIFESYPGLPGEPRWERLIAEDGKLVAAAELDKQDRKRQEAAREYLRKQEKMTAADRDKAAREQTKEQRERDEMIDDAFRVFAFTMTGREAIDGHETIAFSFTPRRKAATRSRMGGMLRHFHGRAWISESDYELVKVDVEALDDLTVGFGLLARLHKGSTLSLERRKVGGEVWLPAKATYTARARVLLLRRMRVGGTSEFSKYRKFSVDTTSTYQMPASQ